MSSTSRKTIEDAISASTSSSEVPRNMMTDAEDLPDTALHRSSMVISVSSATLTKSAESEESGEETATQENFEEDPEFFRLIVEEGFKVPGDSGVSLDSKPSWLDIEKFHTGQRFAEDHLFGLLFAQVMSLFMLFAAPGSLQPLIFSGKSDTPFKAFQRYLSTVVRIRSWHQWDPWDSGQDARRNLSQVRSLHNKYRNAMRKAVDEAAQDDSRFRVQGPLWDDGVHGLLRSDAESALQGATHLTQCPLARAFGNVRASEERISQSEMSVTQFGFVSLMATYPERFGAAWATDEELEGFVHLWRVIGYLLGIEDRFNFCNRGLEGVRERSRVLIRKAILPMLTEANAEWEHMMHCVVEGTRYYVEGFSFEVSLMYLCDTIGLPTPCYRASVKFRRKILFYVTKFIMFFLLRINMIRNMLNRGVSVSIKRAQEASSEWLQTHENRVYPYQGQQSLLAS